MPPSAYRVIAWEPSINPYYLINSPYYNFMLLKFFSNQIHGFHYLEKKCRGVIVVISIYFSEYIDVIYTLDFGQFNKKSLRKYHL